MRLIQLGLTAFALIVATPSVPAEIAPDASLRNPIGQLVELAKNNMMNAIDAANKRIGYCLDLGKATIIKPDAIAKLKLTTIELKIAIFYSYLKAEEACTSDAVNMATTKITMFKTIEFEAYGRNDPEPFTDNNYNFTAAEICCGSAKIFLNAQLNYMGLNADKRAALDAILELKKPFNFFELSEYFDPTPVSAKP